MIKILARTVLLALLSSVPAMAEPITLKLAFTTSDQSINYRAAVQPFVDAINNTPDSPIRVEIYFSAALSKDIARHPDLLRDGTADIAFVVPGLAPHQFPDNPILELPGLFRDIREGTLIFSRLTAANALKGYEDFFVIGTYVSAPESFHGKARIESLKDLQGKKIRAINLGEAALLNALGAVPVQMPAMQISTALSNGSIDAALVPPALLVDYGIRRVAIYHYMLETSGTPTALLMSRKKFESLPPRAQQLIKQYSGAWPATRFIDTHEIAERQVLEELKSEPRRTVTIPTASERSTATALFNSISEVWANENARNRTMLNAVQNELAQIRKTQ